MAVSVRCSNSLAVLAVLAVLAATGCVDELPGVEGTTSLRVEVVSPADGGSADDRLDDADRTVTLRVTALDQDGVLDADFQGAVDIYVHFLGGLTPDLAAGFPLETAELSAGESADVTLDLPRVFGPTFLWVEHAAGDDPTYATGTSDTLWYRDPFIEDVQRPEDEMALGALENSPLEEKQVTVLGSRYGANGRLIVTGTYAQGYTLSDVECADAGGTPPCTTGAYDHVFVFSFSRPEDEKGRAVAAGQAIDGVGGAISEFNGLTEVNFPQTFAEEVDVDPARIPEPIVLDPMWLSDRIQMERAEAALVAAENAVLCPLDEDWDTFNQWKLDIGEGCDDPINIITAGQVPDFDPTDYIGETMPRVVGTLRPINIGSFHVWIVYPRTIDDITLP